MFHMGDIMVLTRCGLWVLIFSLLLLPISTEALENPVMLASMI